MEDNDFFVNRIIAQTHPSEHELIALAKDRVAENDKDTRTLARNWLADYLARRKK